MKCNTCGHQLPADSRFCLSCGSRVEDGAPTVSFAQGGAAAAPATAPVLHGRFVPGTVIAERYRVVAQVGRGGMGEVYRADDLKLGQTVALKFMPEPLTKNTAAAVRMQREVRLARQVSHPNVCRVFDLGEADGAPFISMEFVDGEDLGSLLRRIGRLPQDKALQVAHQLCAGLAEAHAFGVLHRDLKPANVMLDGRGNVRITDFGLAATAEELTGEDARAGTPAYMAPEQLAGQRPTTQSDLYALGLVLYELFSGKEAYPAASITEMLAQRHKGAPAKLSSVVKGIDPAIERVIFQCLEREPQSRPRSALVVAAALPGGDPLSAAIAAGETPSPEMVAAASDEPLVSVGKLWLSLAATVLGLLTLGFLVQRGSVLGLAPIEKPPEIMAEHARQLISQLGYTAEPADSVYWYEVDGDYLRYRFSQGRTPELAHQLQSAVPAPARFIYRQSSRPLVPRSYTVITRTDPPNDIPGDISVVLDASGKLQYFSTVPPQVEEETPAGEPNWAPVLSSAGLATTALTSTKSRGLPPTGFDSRAAWDGTLSTAPIHVEAAAYHGKPVFFEVRAPWIKTASPQAAQHLGTVPLQDWTFVFGATLLWVCSLLIARRNLRLGRGDRKGASRLALVAFLAWALYWPFRVHYAGGPIDRWMFAQEGIGGALFSALFMYLAYLALEPYVRRRWPHFLVSWTRLFAGRISDARVGRDVLLGCLFGILMGIIGQLPSSLASWINIPGQTPSLLSPGNFSSALSYVIVNVGYALMFTFAMVLALLLGVLVTRRVRPGMILGVVLILAWGTVMNLSAGPILTDVASLIIGMALFVFVLLRFGILSAAVCVFVVDVLPSGLMGFGRWYAWPSLFVVALVAAIGVYGFRTALASRPAFGKPVLEE